MGKKLIIPGADFSQNAIALNEITFKVKAGGSVQMKYNTSEVYGTYSAPTTDMIFSVQIDNYINATGFSVANFMFASQTDLKECTISDINGAIPSLYYTFDGCSSLEKVKIRNTGKVEPLSHTFSGCVALTEIDGITDLDVSTSTFFVEVFKDTKLKTLSLNGWNMSACNNITRCVRMFANMTELETLDLSNTVLNSTVAADVYSSGHGGSSGNHFTTNMTKLTKIYVDNVSADDIAYWKSWADVSANAHNYHYELQTITEGGVQRQALVYTHNT